MTIIYGVDTEKPVSPQDVRDAIVACFTQAHKEILDELKPDEALMSPEEFEQIKILNVQQLVRNFFREVGGNYEAPTREAIMLVVKKLEKFASHFRSPDIIERHKNEIMELVSCLH